MKSIQKLFAALAVAVGSVMFASLALASTAQTNIGLPPGVPARLPIGDQQTMLDWIVAKTNGLVNVFVCSMRYTNTNSIVKHVYVQAGSKGFDTYQDYLGWIAIQGKDIIQNLKSRNLCLPNSSIRFVTHIIHDDTESMDGLMSIDDFSSLADADQFTFEKLKILLQCVVINIPNLQSVKIDVGTKPLPCWYTWSNNVSTYSTNTASSIKWLGVKELTRSNYLILSQWYGRATNRVRIEIIVGDKTYTYTQTGDMIRPASMKIAPNQVIVSAARGSDVTVETSINLTDWIPVDPIQVKSETDGVYKIQTGKHPRQFYRAICR